jgi:hypothetical protein
MEDLDRQIAEACARLAPRLGPEPIIAVACIRDEQDVVERFVRHNLAVVDALVVVNHRSRDATPAILDALVAEGLPLAVCHAGLPGKHQADWMSRMARAAAGRLAAHPVVPLDADEFLTGSDPETMRRLLKAIRRDGARALEWLSYVPLATDPADEIDVLARVTHRRAREISRSVKLAAGGGLAADPAFHWFHGMHKLHCGFATIAVAPQQPDLALAHVPVRSVDQLRAKVASNRLSVLAIAGPQRAAGIHYQWLADTVSLAPAMSADDLTRAALAYACDHEPEDRDWVRDPVPILGGPLVHTPAGVPDALERVVWVASDLAEFCAANPQLTTPSEATIPILDQNRRLRAMFQALGRLVDRPDATPEQLVETYRDPSATLRSVPAAALARELSVRIRRRLRSMLGLTRTTS